MPYFENFGQGGYYNQPKNNYSRPSAYSPGGGGTRGNMGMGGMASGNFRSPINQYGNAPGQMPYEARMQSAIAQKASNPYNQFMSTLGASGFGDFNAMRQQAGMQAIPREAIQFMGSPFQQFMPNYNVPSGSYGSQPGFNYGLGNNFGGGY